MNRRKFITAGGAAISLAALGSSFKTEDAEGLIPSGVIQNIRSKVKPIPKEERNARIEKARKLMKENGMTALFMEGGTSLNYFSGVRWGRSERLFGMLLRVDGAPEYIAPKFEESRAVEATGGAKIHTWQENESPFALIAKILEGAGVSGAVGVEETTRFFVTNGLQKATGLAVKDATMVTAGCRAIKSAAETELMQLANEITRIVFETAVKQLKEGMTEARFGALISDLFAEFGCEGGALVLFGEASAHPHGLTKEVKLKKGDIVLIDGGCSLEGYQSDITRTTVFGTATQKMKDVFAIVRSAQDAGLKAAKPGVAAESVDAAARKVIEEAGYGPGYKYFTHRLGHGIGMDGHEWYYLVGGNTRLLEAGNMFSNEPGIYMPGEFGIRIEDEMLITENGARLLLPQQPSLERMF